jgi:hypothetical protein
VRLLASKAVIEISCGRWAHFVRPVKDLTDPTQECSSIPHRLIPYGNFPLLDRSGQSYIVKLCRHFRFASFHENGAFGHCADC